MEGDANNRVNSVKEQLLSSHLECSERLKNDWERICEKVRIMHAY